MHKRIEKVLQIALFLTATYLFLDAAIHFFDIKLFDVQNTWPVSAVSYVRLLDKISGSFILLSVIIALVICRNLDKYRTIVYFTAIWFLFLGAVLIYLGLSTDYSRDFSLFSSLSFWLPFYRQYLILEGGWLVLYSVVVYLWFRTRKAR